MPQSKVRKPRRRKPPTSIPQHALFGIIRGIYPDAKENLPIKTKYTTRYADIGIPSMRIDVEYNGKEWHRDKKKDIARDVELQGVGWTTIRVNKDTVVTFILNMRDTIGSK